MKRVLILILLVLQLVGTTGCKAPVQSLSSSTPKTLAKSDTLPAIPEHPQRVALLTTALAEFWISAGGKDLIVACPLSGVQDAHFKKIFNQKIVDTGTSGIPNLEKIVSANPDLILGLANYTPTSALKSSFQKSSIPYLEVKLDNLEDNFDALRLYGRLTDHQDLVEKQIANIKQEIKTEQLRTSGRKHPKSLMLWSTANAVLMVTPSSKHGELLTLAGGDNIVPDLDSTLNKNSLSMEYIVEHQPDIIFLEMRGDPEKSQNKAKLELFDNPAWQNLKAVQENHVYILPEDIFSVNPGLRSGKAVTYLGQLLYK